MQLHVDTNLQRLTLLNADPVIAARLVHSGSGGSGGAWRLEQMSVAACCCNYSAAPPPPANLAWYAWPISAVFTLSSESTETAVQSNFEIPMCQPVRLLMQEIV